MPARGIVEDAWNKREEFHPSGEFLLIENSCPWKEHVFQLEKETKKEGLIKFVFYSDERGMFRAQTMPPNKASFDMRVPLAKAWRGIRGEELKAASGFTDIEFVHQSGFIGGAWSLETVIQMGVQSIAESKGQAAAPKQEKTATATDAAENK